MIGHSKSNDLGAQSTLNTSTSGSVPGAQSRRLLYNWVNTSASGAVADLETLSAALSDEPGPEMAEQDLALWRSAGEDAQWVTLTYIYIYVCVYTYIYIYIYICRYYKNLDGG